MISAIPVSAISISTPIRSSVGRILRRPSKFRDSRLAYARAHQPSTEGCEAASQPISGDVDLLSLAGYPPQVITNKAGTFVVFRTFGGILGEACVYRVGNF